MFLYPAFAHAQRKLVPGSVIIHIPADLRPFPQHVEVGNQRQHPPVIPDDQGRGAEAVLIDHMAVGRGQMGRPMERGGKGRYDLHPPIILPDRTIQAKRQPKMVHAGFRLAALHLGSVPPMKSYAIDAANSDRSGPGRNAP
ncbi:hypothetical protein HMSSN139_10590 [Paenibacillus sp. HMSSN-139]|nr:hypothetical protein HMSSN139_10590 [Paenibacillus sp. HMSSN-139]